MKTSLASFLQVAVVGLGLLALPAAGLAQASKVGWDTNQPKALEKAKAEKKMVLMDFTGSDWCGWCMKMDKEVFSTPEFQKYAHDNLVLVELDYPHSKFQSPDLKGQNAALKQQYGVRGFPTMVVLDAQGNKIKEFGGYQEGGAKSFIAELDKLKAAGPSTTQAAPAAAPTTQTTQTAARKPNLLGDTRVQGSSGL